MEASVKKFIIDAHKAFREENEDFKRHNWVMEDHKAEAICVVASIIWCFTTENYLRDEDEVRENLEYWFQDNVKQLTELTKIVSRSDLD